jgi:hypothetical protein
LVIKIFPPHIHNYAEANEYHKSQQQNNTPTNKNTQKQTGNTVIKLSIDKNKEKKKTITVKKNVYF